MSAHALGASAAAQPARRRAGVASAFRAERRKLTAQLSSRVLALACALGPFAFGAILSQQSGVPADTLLGVWAHSSGFAVAFVVLGFAGYWGFPVLAGVLAGDLFSSEDRYGTWKTVLTRSSSRAEVFAGKALAAGACSLALTALVALSSLVAGLLFTGDEPLVGLGGNVLGTGECLWLLLASWSLSMLPVLAFTSMAILFSIATRNGIAGVLGPVLVGVLMQLLALIGSGTWVHVLLLASAFDDWHGLLAGPRFYGPLVIGSAVSVLWALACLAASWLILRRRDFAGVPVPRRAGWVLPARAVLAAAVLIVALAGASNLGPVGVTKSRLQASFAPAFEKLTLLQQRELGRPVARGAKLDLLSSCARRSGQSEGAGDDWSCTISLLTATPGANPFLLTPVTYEVSVKSNGCYKAQSPPSFVGAQTMSDARRQTVVNPLSTIYGCFDTTGSPGARAPACAPDVHCAGAPARPAPAGSARNAEREALRRAERAAGPKVMREIDEAEAREQRAAEKPAEPPPPTVGR